MAEKSLKVQFRQRRATASYWKEHKTEVTPGAGEIIVYLPDETQTDISFKIGDGSKNLSELPMFVKVSGGPKGEDGATFIPTVSSDGVISWSNNGGLSNPAAVNIKGPTGAQGDPGTNGTSAKITGATASVDSTSGTPQVTVTSGGTDSSRSFNFAFTGLKGPKGATGAQGPTGETGPRGEQGARGETGATGDGIKSITKTSTAGLVDTYTITFTSGKTPTTFTVTNGQNGSDATVEWGTF